MSGGTINRLMAALFLVICVVFIVHELRQKPRVLIVHSYHKEYSWAEEVSEGINRVFEGKYYTVHWHYMDTKRHPDLRDKAVSNAQQVIDQWQPNVVIAIADNAQNAMKPYIGTDISIVFAGVVGDPDEYGYKGAPNVTGIRERWPMEELEDGLETMFISGRTECEYLRVRHIGDGSTTGKLIAEQIKDFRWGERFEISSMSVGDFVAWKREICAANGEEVAASGDRCEKAEEKANGEVDVVLFSLYHTLARRKVVPPKDDEHESGEGNEVMPPNEVMKWTRENLKVPGVGGWGFYVEDGGMMAIAVSAYEQGEEAARLATKIIDDGISPERLESRQFLIYLREPLLKEHGIEVSRIYEAFARANNNYYSSRFDPDPRVEDTRGWEQLLILWRDLRGLYEAFAPADDDPSMTKRESLADEAPR